MCGDIDRDKTLCDFRRDIYCKHCGCNFGSIYNIYHMDNVIAVKCAVCNYHNTSTDMLYWLQYPYSDHKNQERKFIDFVIYDTVLKEIIDLYRVSLDSIMYDYKLIRR